jgi:2-methylcitrate synthase
MTMSDNVQTMPKPKKSVALSGTPAGNTALCTVGRSGNDLHYRGYDIKDLATKSSFEEVAHLLVHGTLPTASRLAAYRTKLKRLRGLPAIVAEALNWSRPMPIRWTCCAPAARSWAPSFPSETAIRRARRATSPTG